MTTLSDGSGRTPQQALDDARRYPNWEAINKRGDLALALAILRAPPDARWDTVPDHWTELFTETPPEYTGPFLFALIRDEFDQLARGPEDQYPGETVRVMIDLAAKYGFPIIYIGRQQPTDHVVSGEVMQKAVKLAHKGCLFPRDFWKAHLLAWNLFVMVDRDGLVVYLPANGSGSLEILEERHFVVDCDPQGSWALVVPVSAFSLAP